MSPAVAARKPARKRATRVTRPPGPPTRGWWGDGPAPWERWPGASVRLEMAWVFERQRWESANGAFYYDAAAADRAVEFFRTFLVHHKGRSSGTPFEPLDWQRDLLLRPLFGVKRMRDDRRRFRKVFLAIPRGNGKSQVLSGISLLVTFADGEPGAEGYAAAADREQARIVFGDAKTMVEASRDERGRNPFMDYGPRLEVFRNAIISEPLNASLKVLSSDSKTKHGQRPHLIAFDEFHAQPTRELYETLSRGLIKRDQPLLMIATTAGVDDESICAEEWDYARRVIASDGEHDEISLPVVFEAKPEDDWTDPAVWRRVNPSLGVTITEEALEAECRAAQNEPRKLNDFLRFHLNRWVNQAIAWLPLDWWDACTDAPRLPAAGEVVAAGLDLAQRVDLAAFVVAVRHQLEEAVAAEVSDVAADGAVVRSALSLNFAISLFPFFWLPEDTLRERERTDRVPYSLWAEQGLLTVTEGPVIDFDRIKDDIIQKIAQRFGLKGHRVGFDPAFASDLAPRLQAAGMQMVEVLQNYKNLNTPSQALYALIKARRVRHGCAATSHPLRWCAENVAVRQDDAGRIRPVKPRKSTKRIDGVVATVMALDQLLREPERKRSRYETEEPLVLSSGADAEMEERDLWSY